MDIPYYREYELPWTNSSGQERKFRRLLLQVLGVVFLLGVIWPFIPTPDIDPNEIVEIPPRIAQLLLEQKPPPPPPEPEPEPEPEPDPLDEQEPEQVAEVEPEPEPEPEPVPPPDLDKIAREQAQAALLPFTDDLIDLRDNELADQVADDRELTSSVSEGVRNERSMITSKAGTASGGINTASMSRNTGGSGLVARSTTSIDSPVDAVGQSAGGARRTGTSGKASRSREEIELIFDKNKGAILLFTTGRYEWTRRWKASSCCD